MTSIERVKLGEVDGGGGAKRNVMVAADGGVSSELSEFPVGRRREGKRMLDEDYLSRPRLAGIGSRRSSSQQQGKSGILVWPRPHPRIPASTELEL